MDGYCLYCMSALSSQNARCPVCGHVEGDYQNQPHQLPCGAILAGGFLVGRALGQGGFGITYVGRDLNLNIKVAIKEYYPVGMVTRYGAADNNVAACSQEALDFFIKGKKQFLAEAKNLAVFSDDPNIVHVRQYFEENGTAYIVMEYVEGRTLLSYAKGKGGRLSASEALRLTMPLMFALDRVHRKYLLHRDISPDNIMLQDDGAVKLIDFGSSRQYSLQTVHNMTVAVKPGYAPEEQYHQQGNQGPWTDVYALCATIYRLTTGDVPAQSPDRVQSGARLLRPSQLGADFTPAQEAAIMHGLSIRPEDRIRNMPELLQELGAMPQGYAQGYEKQYAIWRGAVNAGSANTMLSGGTNGYGNAARGDGKRHNGRYGLIIASACAVSALVVVIALIAILSNSGRQGPGAVETVQEQGVASQAPDNASEVLSVPDASWTAEPAVLPESTPLQLRWGDVVGFGRYEQDGDGSNGPEILKWQVIAVDGGKALLLTEQCIECMSYNSMRTSVTWETSSIRAWLNGGFYDGSFTDQERARILLSNLDNPTNSYSKVSGGGDTSDHVFLLSLTEVKGCLTANEDRTAGSTAYAISAGSYVNSTNLNSWWWLRSPGDSLEHAALVFSDGVVHFDGDYVETHDGSIRPAIWIDLG